MNYIFKLSNMTARVAATLMVSAILTGCAGGGDEPSPTLPDSYAVRFTRPDAPTVSRAALETLFDSFCVWTRKTMYDDSKQTVMDAYEVNYDGSNWIYEDQGSLPQYLKYWDFSASEYLFAAIAPASGVANSSLTADYKFSVTGVSGNSAPGGVTDWLIARHLRSNMSPVTDTDLLDPATAFSPQPSVMNSDVEPHFHHIMSQIEFRAFSNGGDLLISAIEIVADTPLSISADYDETLAATWRTTNLNWTNHSLDASDTSLLSFAAADEIDYISVTGTDRAHATSLGSRLEIPQDFPGEGNTMHITVTAVVNGKTLTGTFELSEGWNTDTHYIYYIAFDGDNIILMDISAKEWESGADNPVEETQTNW